MEKKEKELLIKDLCNRLPYKTNILYDNHSITEIREFGLGSLHDFMFDNAEVKPYLRPMSSMTEEERKELEELTGGDEISISGFGIRVLCGGCYGMMWDDCSEIVDWLNAHHFDYRGLICKGLALEAPENMYV